MSGVTTTMFTSFRGPYQTIFNRIKKYVKYFSKDIVLDIGCGRGEFLEALKLQGIISLGLDTDIQEIEQLKEKGFRVENISFIDFRTDKEFSGIMASHIVEHISGEEIMGFLSKCRDLLEKSGILVIITPNFQNLEVATETFWLDLEHKRPYPLLILENLLIDTGFEIVEKGFDKDTKFKGFKGFLRRFNVFGKYFTPKDAYIVGRKI